MIIAVAAAVTISGTFASVATRRGGQSERREAEAHQHFGVIVADQLFRQPLGDVSRAGVVLDLEDDLLAGDRVAMLLHIKLCPARSCLPVDACGPVIGRIMPMVTVLSSARAAPALSSAAQSRSEHPQSRHRPFSSRSALWGRPAICRILPTLALRLS